MQVDTKSYTAKIDQLNADYIQRIQRRENARQKLAEAESVAAPLVAEREALRAAFQDATFEEDAARIREVSNQRKALSKQIAAAEKATDRARKAFEKADFNEEEEGRKLGYEVARLAHELNEKLTEEEAEFNRVLVETRGTLLDAQKLADKQPGGHHGRMQHLSEIVREARANDPFYQDRTPEAKREHNERMNRAAEEQKKGSPWGTNVKELHYA